MEAIFGYIFDYMFGYMFGYIFANRGACTRKACGANESPIKLYASKPALPKWAQQANNGGKSHDKV